MEIWKEYGSYKVSNIGNVKGKFGRLMKPMRINGYLSVSVCENGSRKNMKVHRLVALCFLDNSENKPFVDHIDGNPLNNKVENLRWCSNQQNQMNRDKSKNNTSGFKGVSWDKYHQKYKAQIIKDGKPKNLGYFDTPEEASLVYVKASRELFRDFSRF